ncbi:hypothetical protein J0K78_17030 [Halobacillus sp. GSS1]|uniref:hypothetical protein n=1 Tax=Halobacillus sp. GSS1 TaxID=2815919 RepID=UPI001A8CB06A|nr:hypothetical protein [Halobacillus sp. GSS1]MBN9655982.1 hypothetical protein [Halobacillus sp. GSS1]
MANYKEQFEKALNMRIKEVTPWYNSVSQKLQSAFSKINLDKELTEEGKQKRRMQLQQSARKQLLKDAIEMKRQRNEILDQAIAEAKEVADKPVELPSDGDQARFKRNLTKFQTDLMLTNRFDQAMRKLNEFTDQHVSSQYHAEELAAVYPTIIQTSLGVAEEPGKAKSELSSKFDEINTALVPEDVREARSTIESAEREKEAPLFGLAVTNHVRGLLGQDIANNLNNPEGYLTVLEAQEADDDDGKYKGGNYKWMKSYSHKTK